MDRVFDTDARLFDKEVQEQEQEFKKRGLCPECGQYMLNGICDFCV